MIVKLYSIDDIKKALNLYDDQMGSYPESKYEGESITLWLDSMIEKDELKSICDLEIEEDSKLIKVKYNWRDRHAYKV